MGGELNKELSRIEEGIDNIMRSLVRMKNSLNKELINKDCCFCRYFLSNACSGRYSPSIVCPNFER